MESILNVIPEDVWAAFVVAVVGVIGAWLKRILDRGAEMLKQYTGVKISEAARSTIHSAIMTGIENQLMRRPESTADELVEAGRLHALTEGAADSIKTLGVSDGALTAIGRRYAQQAMTARLISSQKGT